MFTEYLRHGLVAKRKEKLLFPCPRGALLLPITKGYSGRDTLDVRRFFHFINIQTKSLEEWQEELFIGIMSLQLHKAELSLAC